MPSGYVSIRFGLQGPNVSSSAACATGLQAVSEGAQFIRDGKADVMLCGGTEACLSPLTSAGFSRMKALASSKWMDDPHLASRPFDRSRDGFVIGEGAGMLVLEDLEHAKNRGAQIYAEIRGFGLAGDGYHISASSGLGAERAMKSALEDAELHPSDISYINAHATSTPQGDAVEASAIAQVFAQGGENTNFTCPPVSSTKGATGHLLGAAGAVEAVFTALSVKHNVIPPTLNYDGSEDPFLELPVVRSARQTQVETALCNSFGFGGANVAVVMCKH